MAEPNKEQENPEIQAVAPGTVVTPGGAPVTPVGPAPSAQPQVPASPPAQQDTSAPAATPQPAVSEAPSKSVASTESESTSHIDKDGAVVWTASEFIAHEKSSAWYGSLALGAAAAAAIVYIINRDFISVGVVLLAAIIFGVYGSRKPRQLEYRVDLGGVTISDKFYPYDSFHSFSVIPEGAFSSIVMMPLNRFSVPLTIYFANEDQEAIAGIMALQLPYEQRRRDAVDNLMRKIRF